MPYSITRSHPRCSGYAVIKTGTSKLMGCHPTREKAKAQLAALYANEGATAMKNPRTFTALAADQIGEDGTSWIEVMPTADKARNGRYYFTVTREDLDTLVGRIKENATRIPIDYDHPEDTGSSTIAAGWFTGETKIVETGEDDPRGNAQDHDSVWAQVKWTPTGKANIEGGEFRFLSPEWEFVKRDSKTGLLTKLKDIVATTLTNRPFFRNLAPVLASDLDSDQAITAFAEDNDVSREDLLRALADVEPDTPLEKVLADAKAPYGDVAYADPGYQKDGKKRYPIDTEEHARAAWSYINKKQNAAKYSPENLAKVKAKIQSALKKYGANVNDTMNASKEDEMDKEVLKALGLDEDASAEDTLAAVVEMREKLAITEGFDKSVLEQFAKTTASELQKDRALAQLQRDTAAKQHERDREDLLAKGVEQGRILPVHKDALRAVFDATTDGAEKVRAIIEAAPEHFFGETGSGGPGLDDAPEMRQYEDKRGNRIAAVADPEWLDHKAQAILAENGKTLKTATAAEYVDALEKAQALAESPR